ncbi:MAG: hypothetical protein IJM51_08785 [Clostridia bacterium]|nr:hypothetical protein [Clostridia bacterium]
MVIITDSTNTIDKQRFNYAISIYNEARNTDSNHSIGTLREKSLHAVLKWYYEPDGSRHELPVGDYIADIVGEDGIIEIQTRGLSHLKPKLTGLLELCRVTVVHPVIVSRRVISLDSATGEIISIRRSPKHGSIYREMRELYSLRDMIANEKLTLKFPFLTADEYRTFGVKTNRRKKQRTHRGEYTSDVVPTDILDELTLAALPDYAMLIPAGLPEVFSAAGFASAAGTEEANARMAVNLLIKTGLVIPVGKDGKRKIFSLSYGKD